MKQYWEQFSEYYNTRVIRERVILMLTVFAIIYAFFHYGFFLSLENKEAAAMTRIEDMGKEVTRLSAQEKVFAQAIANDPNADKKRELARLQLQLENLDKDLMELSVGLIAASQLPQALREVLNASQGLKLLAMETRAPAKLPLIEPPLIAEEENQNGEKKEKPNEMEQAKKILDGKNKRAQKSEEDERRVGVFKHSVLIALEGNYFNVIAYLKSLEGLPWKIYWQELNYEVTRYPNAEVILEVYTLSTEEGFIGV